MNHPDFELLRREPIEALQFVVESYRHTITGARHLHLVADDSHNAFLVAFLTVPSDSTGVAHILEHTALCGSKRYPVRDPFFMMLRRSLQTFMNALTSSDWTAYPFASQSRKDFDNLMNVYLDAAFFPNLQALDFAQEGCRIELSKPEDPDSDLVYKGVVFNEMKGAMSSAPRLLWQTLSHHLFPTTTYHFNSGGDPEHIPDLTWSDLRAFHARHYHPSNATFMTFGDIPAAEHQATFQENVLKSFGPMPIDFQVQDEVRLTAPITVTAPYAMDGGGEMAHKTHIALGWLLGNSIDQESLLRAHLLGGVLLDNSSSPLLHALETTPLGSAPSPICGLDDSGREMVFACGVEGSEADRADAVETLIFDVLHKVATEGVPFEQVASVLHQLELSRREIGGDGMPYGLKLMLTALPVTLHGGDPVTALALDSILDKLREEIKDPEFIKTMVRSLLLENVHRVRVILTPDAHMNERLAAEEAERLRQKKTTLDAETLQSIVERAEALKKRQEEEDDPEILPKLHLSDVPETMSIPELFKREEAGFPTTWFQCPTNRLVYQQVVIETPAMEESLLDLLPIFSSCLTEVGCGGRDYLQTQAFQASISGGIGARASVRGAVHNIQEFRSSFLLSAKALTRNHGALAELLCETWETPRFDEHSRLRELIAQMRASSEMRITDNGHALALSAASANLTPSAAINNRWGGLDAIARLKQLDNALNDPQALAEFAEKLEAIGEIIRRVPRQLLVVGEEPDFAAIKGTLERQWRQKIPSAEGSTWTTCALGLQENRAWATVTPVHFCAKAYGAVHYAHPDAPVLSVLGQFLKNGFLHKAIREQGGAYGGGAGFDSDSGTFRFFSYRDPRLGETLADFDRSLHWLTDTRHEDKSLEEAVLGVISSIDRPGSPAGEARRAFHDTLHGRTPEQRRLFRGRVLQVTVDDLRRMVPTYLKPELACIGVVSNAVALKKEAKEDWKICTL